MSKIDDLLSSQARQTDSMFQAVLAREDLGRVARLREIAIDMGRAAQQNSPICAFRILPPIK